jgi:hypothetical protein
MTPARAAGIGPSYANTHPNIFFTIEDIKKEERILFTYSRNIVYHRKVGEFWHFFTIADRNYNHLSSDENCFDLKNNKSERYREWYMLLSLHIVLVSAKWKEYEEQANLALRIPSLAPFAQYASSFVAQMSRQRTGAN